MAVNVGLELQAETTKKAQSATLIPLWQCFASTSQQGDDQDPAAHPHKAAKHPSQHTNWH